MDIPVKYLSFFLEDDTELGHIKKVNYVTLTSSSCYQIITENERMLIAVAV